VKELYVADQFAAFTRAGRRGIDPGIVRRSVLIEGEDELEAGKRVLQNALQCEAVNQQLLAGDADLLSSLGLEGELRKLFLAGPKTFSSFRFLGLSRPVLASLRLHSFSASLDRAQLIRWRSASSALVPAEFRDRGALLDSLYGEAGAGDVILAEVIGTQGVNSDVVLQLLVAVRKGDVSLPEVIRQVDLEPITNQIGQLDLIGVVGGGIISSFEDVDTGQEVFEVECFSAAGREFLVGQIDVKRQVEKG
jgi:hypothetical protein